MKLLPAIALLGLPAIGFSQWVHYPTAGVAAKSRWHSQPGCAGAAAGGRQTGFLGIWHTARLIPCDAELSRFINCGNEIGGSPLARYFGLDMPGRRQQEPLHSRDRNRVTRTSGRGRPLCKRKLRHYEQTHRKLHFKFPPGGDIV